MTKCASEVTTLWRYTNMLIIIIIIIIISLLGLSANQINRSVYCHIG